MAGLAIFLIMRGSRRVIAISISLGRPRFLCAAGCFLAALLVELAGFALVVTGSVLTVENNKRIQIVEDTYTTVGYIEQMPVSTDKVPVPNPCNGTTSVQKTSYGEYIYPEDLDFPGANYVVKPEFRPYYVFNEPKFSLYGYDDTFYVVEFTPLEPVGDDGAPVEVEITKVLFSKDNNDQGTCTMPDLALHEGDHITVCQCWDATRHPMEPGEKYAAELTKWWNCPERQVDKYVVYNRPHSGRTDRNGKHTGTENLPDDKDWGYQSPYYPQIAHVTGKDFYEKGNPGYNFVQWAKNVEQRVHSFCALGTNSLELLPSWHKKTIVLSDGREITPEELESGQDTLITPAKSVTASDDNNIAYYTPMTSFTASFQIPNGTIQQFDAALKEHVPEAGRLNITYDDRGYSEIRKSLDNSRAMALLLLLAGIMAALSIVALLLYFFVVKEKKRTAIERSLGMTKSQCRVSLLAGLIILTVFSACAGSVCGTLALDKVREPQVTASTTEERDSLYSYDTRYSTWAAGRELAEKTEIDVEVPVYVSYTIPLCISLLVLVLALMLMTAGFRTDPIYLLSTREKE